MLAAVPVVFWLSVGTSVATRALNVGAPDAPLGVANTRLAAWLCRLLKVKVPVVVTGEPVMLNRPVESARPTDVTFPVLVPGGVANVPSARKKLTVPPPEAGTRPCRLDVNRFKRLVA